ncbi:MAG: Fur family transcriptional regulator [Clostridiaceae bacterium]
MEYEKFLKEKNIKITKGRVAILGILEASSKSLTAEDIYLILESKKMDINLSTVYRTLDLFEGKQVAQKVFLMEGSYGYSFKRDDHRHLLKCELCKKEVLVPCPIKQIEEIINSEAGFTITAHKIKLSGICAECKGKK